MIKAIFFDLDGVIVDAVKLHQQAFIEAIAPYRHVTEEEHMRDLNALPTKKKLAILGVSEDHVEEIYNRKQERTWALIPKTITPIPIVNETINKIKDQKIPFAVCSNSIRKTTGLLLEQANVDGFEFYLSNQDVTKPKPDPEMYIKAMEKLSLKKEEVIIVEDSPVGVEAAQKSGAHVCQIGNPYEIDKVLEMYKEMNSKQDTYLQQHSEP
jgi:beta-phosphoglucomutase